MRNMSFSMTTQQFEERTKTVTRRAGWMKLKPGDVVMGVVKAMGLKKGEKVQKLHPFRVKSNTIEPLTAIRNYPNDCELEGFPEMTPDEFIEMFCKHNQVKPDRIISRIEFDHLEGGGSTMDEPTLLIHRFEDGGARFGILRDSEQVDWDFWRVATEDEIVLWLIMKVMRDADFRESLFVELLAEGTNHLVALKWLRLIDEVESGQHTLPA